MSNPYCVIVTCAAIFLAAITMAEAADAPSFPRVTVEIPIEVQNDWAYESDDETAEFDTLFTVIEPAITIALSDRFSIFAGLVLQPVQAPPSNDGDRLLDDQGLFIEVLKATYATERFSVFGGKFTSDFGIAWDAAPGVYGTDLAEEYEQAERLGVGGSVTLGWRGLGRHTIAASSFFADTSSLAESALTRRKKTRRADGGPGNTGGLDSFAISLGGGDIEGVPGLRYHLAFIHQGGGADGEKVERGVAVGAEYALQVSDMFAVTPILEYVTFDNAGGVDGQDRFYLTGGIALTYGNWNLALASTRKDTATAAGDEIDERQSQVSAGYAFKNGFGVDLGWKTVRNAGIDTRTLGMLLRYAVGF